MNGADPIKAPRQFDCTGCGVHVFAFHPSYGTKRDLCAMCQWVMDTVGDDPEKQARLRRLLDRLNSPATQEPT